MSARHLSVYGLRRALIAGIQRVVAQREEINRVNVFPLADHDTGTNLAFTLGAVLQGLREPRFADAGEVLRRAALEAGDGARGNSGVILAHFLQGLAEALPPGGRLTPAALAQAAAHGSAHARQAMAEPREGTMLSVIQAFADAWQAQAAAGDLRVCLQRALERAREALECTREQLKVLRAAGVVDAGALGFVTLLEGMAEYSGRGRGVAFAELPAELLVAGVEAHPGRADDAGHRFCVQCLVSADAVDRGALKAALLALPLSRLVLAGSRERVRLHAHLGDPRQLFATAARFGAVSREQADDLRAAPPAAPRAPVVIVTDSGADLPPELLDPLQIHLVPQRVSIGGREFVDGVSISHREFYREMRTNPVAPRSSQPPPGDFRRLFEFLLAHHERVLDVSLARTLSGTLQSAAGAAARTAPGRIDVFDSGHAAAALGLLVIWAAEAAQAGLDAPRILEGLARMRRRTDFHAVARDIRYGVRGGRAPRLALPLTRLLRVSILFRNRADGRIGFGGGMWGRVDLPERFARRIARRLDPARRYRLIVGHGDCPEDAERVRAALQANVRQLDRIWVVETGVAVGTHAGPGALVIGVQDYEPPRP
ncbi:MAG TPA: DegV family protein [Opitutaceae bacterium]|nr:DegV family protein [Opitutaceae bacterium]